jgi:LPPG:FO 2-phospho-L-lactate transferase
VRLRASVPALDVVVVGADSATPAPGVVDALRDADLVLLPPSNPIVSIGTILNVPGIGAAVRETAAPVVGVSPIVAGAAVRGMADRLLSGLGIEGSAAGVALHYGARADGGYLDGWLVHTSDAADLERLRSHGVATEAVPLLMTDPEATAAMARAALDFAGRVSA